MSHWLIQGDPKVWDVYKAWATRSPIDSWSINRYFRDVEVGDDVGLWLSGSADPVGLYALGTASGDPMPVHGDADDPLWIDVAQAARVRWRLPIDLHDDFHDHPIPKSQLVLDPRFAASAIVQMPRGSIFRLSDPEWQAVLEVRTATSPRNPHRNPVWVRDELILALELYLRHAPQLIDDDHPDVMELSSVLNLDPPRR